MPYDVELAERIRHLVRDVPAVTERRMFGGLAFLVGGHMAVAAGGQGGLLVRVDPARSASLMASAHARPMEMKGRPITGWLTVDRVELRTERQLSTWVDLGVAYARSLPVKT